MYTYYCIRTSKTEEFWATIKIEEIIEQHTYFVKAQDGIYEGNGFFGSIGLMNVLDRNSWSNLDYDADKTNYISFVFSSGSDGNVDLRCKYIMEVLSVKLSAAVQQEK